jgi:mannitol/fructose-specific phosphotransferase system IIA component (Ntr-type)
MSLIIILTVMWMRSVPNNPSVGIVTEPVREIKKEKPVQIPSPKLAKLCSDFTDLIILDLEGKTKNEIFSGIVKFAIKKGLVKDGKFLYESLSERENRGTSAIGDGIALPEAAFVEMSRPYAFILCRTKEPVDFYSIDRIPVQLLLVSLKSDKINFLDLKPISRILQLLKSDASRSKIMDARTENDIYKLWEETPL